MSDLVVRYPRSSTLERESRRNNGLPRHCSQIAALRYDAWVPFSWGLGGEVSLYPPGAIPAGQPLVLRLRTSRTHPPTVDFCRTCVQQDCEVSQTTPAPCTMTCTLCIRQRTPCQTEPCTGSWTTQQRSLRPLPLR